MRVPALLLPILLICGCASKRVLHIENQLLIEQQEDLRSELVELKRSAMPHDEYARHPTILDVSRFLDASGYSFQLADDESHIRLDYGGANTRFAVTIQVFEGPGVLFMSTKNLLHLSDAQGTESVVLLLVRLATLNYEMLVGKFQLNPESGEVLLSAELHLQDGLSRERLTRVLEHLTSTADKHFPELARAAAGNGM